MVTASSPEIELLASHRCEGLSLFVMGERATRSQPANGGLRLWDYPSDSAAHREAHMLATCMAQKHRLYRTGFCGAKLVARTQTPHARKGEILDLVHGLLEDLDGTVYTGCDLNVSVDDMQWLGHRSSYVLAALNVHADASVATAHGVVGSLRACLERHTVRRVLVHGTGAVGATVARRLAASGFTVFTVDRVPSRADIPGCIPVEEERWTEVESDAFIPCSSSGLIDATTAARLTARLVVSATNGPIRDGHAASILAERGVEVLPDPLSNAGAVVADSIEFFNPVAWRSMSAKAVYRFVEHTLHRGTDRYLERWRPGQAPPALEPFMHPISAPPVGLDARAEREEAVA